MGVNKEFILLCPPKASDKVALFNERVIIMETLGASNKRIKLLTSLKRKSARQKEGMVFLEGERIVRDSVRYGADIVSVFYRDDYDGEKLECADSFILPGKVFDSVTDTVTPQGICAIARIQKEISLNACSVDSDLIVLCDNIRDPGNMGTIIRTAHAFGAGALMYTQGCADPYGLKCVRSSMGSIFALRLKSADSNDIKHMKECGWRMAAGILSDTCTNLTKARLSGKCIITVGSEADGVSDEMACLADIAVKIPMKGGAESLNAAVAASIMMYEHYRQNL